MDVGHTCLIKRKVRIFSKHLTCFSSCVICALVKLISAFLIFKYMLIGVVHVVQMHCLTKHDEVVSYMPWHFDEIQHSFYSIIFDQLGL